MKTQISITSLKKRLAELEAERAKIEAFLAAYAALSSDSAPVAVTPPERPRKEAMVAWLRAHPGSTRAEIVAGTGIGANTVGVYLSKAKDAFVRRKNGWHAK